MSKMMNVLASSAAVAMMVMGSAANAQFRGPGGGGPGRGPAPAPAPGPRPGPAPGPGGSANCSAATANLRQAEREATDLGWVTNSAQLGPFCHNDYNCIVSWQERYNEAQRNLQRAQDNYNRSCF